MNEKENKGTIVMAIYKFSGYGMDIEEYSIVSETEKSYVVDKVGYTKGRIPKDEVGMVTHHTSDFCPYVRVFLLNATKNEVKEELAKWFENKANDIRR